MKAAKKKQSIQTAEADLNNTAEAERWVAYYRVSTKKQGLGLDAQRAAVVAAAAAEGATIIAEVEEKESGKECNRPELNRAIALAKHHSAALVVAKADRLSRDLGFACQIVKSLRVIALNLPKEAMQDTLLFGVYFGLADREAKMISERTKAALAALKAKGVKLGRPDAATSITPQMIEAATESRRRRAAENPNNVASANEIRRYLSTEGNKRTLQAIAEHLTAAGYYTSRGVFHTPKSVSLLCKANGITLR